MNGITLQQARRSRMPAREASSSSSTLRGRGVRRTEHDDVYIASMMYDQARQFLTEGDNRIHTPRLPSPFRRALLPDPVGQARPDVAYFHIEVMPTEEEPARQNEGLFKKAQRLVGMLWRRLIEPRPLAHGEAAQRLLDDC